MFTFLGPLVFSVTLWMHINLALLTTPCPMFLLLVIFVQYSTVQYSNLRTVQLATMPGFSWIGTNL